MRKFTKIFFSSMSFFIFVNTVMAQKKGITTVTATNERKGVQKIETTSSVIQKIDPELLSNPQQDQQGYSDMEQAKPTYRIVTVEIKCTVTEVLLKIISNNRGRILSSSVENNSIVAKVPLFALEKIAASNDVRYIQQSANKSKTPDLPLSNN